MGSHMHQTDSILDAAAAHMTPSYRQPRLVLARGEGAKVWDTEGREYLDFAGGIGVNVIGHAHPRVVAAINEQASRLCHTSNMFHNRPHVAICDKIANLCFGSRVFLCNSGTEAVEAALKIARRHFYNRGDARSELVAAHGGFHGRTMGALSITGKEAYRKGFGPLIPGVRHVPYGELQAIRRAVGPQTAAVILEPILGNAGVIVPPQDYLREVREICDDHGTLLILDEVQTGVGRTGAWFAHQHEGVNPDVMTVAKAIGGGLPLGAMITTEEVAKAFQPGVHGTTFGGNPVACAAGLATIEVIEQEDLLENATTLGGRLKAHLSQILSARTEIEAVRGLGMLVGIETSKSAKDVQIACRARGLLLSTAGERVLRLFPPLNSEVEQLDQCVEILEQAIEQAPEGEDSASSQGSPKANSESA